MRSAWFGGVGVLDVQAALTAVAAAQSKADAAMRKATLAADTASTAQSQAFAATETSSTAVATLEQLNTAVQVADRVHASFAQKDADLALAIDRLAARVQVMALGYSALLAMLTVGAGTDVTLALSRQLDVLTYNVELASVPGATLTVKSRTRSTLIVTVKATAALAVGTPIVAAAWI